jgi:nucleoside-diphosphate-sugar epimerase
MRKLMDSSKARAAGWNPKTSLEEGILETINWYLSNMVKQ